MDVERLRKIEEIFHAAVELSPTEREPFLARSCDGDDDLRLEVISLLESDDGFDSLIDSAPRSLIRGALESAPVAQNDDLIGSEIGHYKVDSLIGEGGMGTVYRARDLKLERHVAIKFLSEQFATDRGRRERFFREAKAASALNHPNILTVHEIGDFGRTFYIVTEFVQGETLKQRLKRERPPIDETVAIAAQIASALAAAHEAGIIHRDIKPDNVMIRRDGIVKVLDFGIAKLDPSSFAGESDSEAETRVEAATTPGMIIGTPQYMSPEQARGHRVDYRSDIFSLGVVLYEMLAGTPPFKGATNIDTIGSLLKDEPAPLATLVDGLPPELERVVNRSLVKDRDARYQNIAALLADLGEVRRSAELKALPRVDTEAVPARTTIEETSSLVTQARFSVVHFALLGLLVAAAGAAVYWFFLRLPAVAGPTDFRLVEIVSWASTPNEIYSIGSFAPDGKKIAFASTSDGRQQIWVKQTALGDPTQVTKDEHANKNPVWSPNGEEIAYISQRRGEIGIWRIPSLGGSAVLVTTFTDAGTQLRAWRGTDSIYYESSNELFVVGAKGGDSRRVTDLKAKGFSARSIAISSDEKRIAFIASEDKRSAIWVAEPPDAAPRKIFESEEEIRNTIWAHEGRGLYFSRRIDDTFQIFSTDAAGSAPVRLASGERDSLVLDAIGDGKQILFGSAKEESDVWGVNPKDGKEFTIASNIDSELWPSVARDGRTVAFQSVKNLNQGNKLTKARIFSAEIGGGRPVELVADAFLPVWSPDGRTLAYLRMEGTTLRIETVSSAGGAKTVVASGGIPNIDHGVHPYTRLQAAYFSWSPDGKRIAYISDKGGQSNVWIVGADGSNDSQITMNTDPSTILRCPLWSPDGRSIAFTTRLNFQGMSTLGLEVVDTETRAARQLTRQTTFFRLLGWTSGTELLVAGIEGSSILMRATDVSLRLIGTAGGDAREIAKLTETYLYNIHLSPDAKSVAFAAHRDSRDNLWIAPLAGGAPRQITANNDSRVYFSTLAWSPDGGLISFGKQSRYSLLSMLASSKQGDN